MRMVVDMRITEKWRHLVLHICCFPLLIPVSRNNFIYFSVYPIMSLLISPILTSLPHMSSIANLTLRLGIFMKKIRIFYKDSLKVLIFLNVVYIIPTHYKKFYINHKLQSLINIMF